MIKGFHPWQIQAASQVMERYTIRDYRHNLSAELIAPMPFALYWMHNLVTLDIIERLSWGCTWRRIRSGRWSWSRVKGQLKIVTGRWFGKPFSNKCYQCDYTPTEARKLRIHLKTHTGKKSNKCNLCDYASIQAGDLRRHLQRHTGEKSNKCNQCDYASSQAVHLRKHLKMHSGEKPNKCSQCDFASSQASNLRTHVKTHSGEKSKICNQCDYASSQECH